MSRAATPFPSRWAAIPRMAAMVTTPVPPMPVTVMPKGPSRTGMMGSGRVGNGLVSVVGAGLRSLPPFTLTKLGRSP